MKTIWASFPAISLDWIDERRDCLVFQHCSWLADNIGICRQVISVKIISDLFRKDLLQGSLKSTGCGRNVASQIKWLSCMFTSIFGDISMTIQAETLLKGEGWRCPFTQERAGVIHQPGCCPFSTASPSCLLLTIPPRRARTSLLPPSINISLSVILSLSGLAVEHYCTLKASLDFLIYHTWSSAADLTTNKSSKKRNHANIKAKWCIIYHMLACCKLLYILSLGSIKVLHYTLY